MLKYLIVMLDTYSNLEKREKICSYPQRLFLFENMILVSQFNNCIMSYQLDGKFISKFDDSGSGRLGFEKLQGV